MVFVVFVAVDVFVTAAVVAVVDRQHIGDGVEGGLDGRVDWRCAVTYVIGIVVLPCVLDDADRDAVEELAAPAVAFGGRLLLLIFGEEGSELHLHLGAFVCNAIRMRALAWREICRKTAAKPKF